ncbi:MAG: ChbG/HpnK family deacetylase [Planctomycetes bacterium]|nr:ChbG/HpnK family deacetylase [Planctomycetota bacterium]
MAGRIIVNADDFGLCAGVNRAVEQAHTTGVLTSATIMAGASAAVEAVEMSRRLPGLGVGVHLNLLEGPPVSTDPRVRVLLGEKGEFAFSASKLAIRSIFSGRIRQAMGIELAAQVKWVIDRGIVPTHLDSHKHLHSFPSIYPIVVSVAKRFGIKAIRWPFEPGFVCDPVWPAPDKGGKRRAGIVRAMAKINYAQNDTFVKNNMFLGLANTGRIDAGFWRAVAASKFGGVAEVMTHPGFIDGLDPARTRLIEERRVELDAMCSEETKKCLSEAGIELTHYGKI